MSTNWQLAGMWGQANYTDSAGNVISGSLTVYSDAARTIPATLYTDETKGSIGANPVSADDLGNFSFFAIPGIYYGIFNHAGVNTNTVHLVDPHPSDPALATALQVVAADSTMVVDNSTVGTVTIRANVGTGAGTVAAGDDARWGAINGIPVTGTPSTGWVPRASGASTAAWAQLSATDVGAMPSGSGFLIANNLSEGTPATMRASLGLGGAATLAVGTTTGTVAAGDDSRFGKLVGATTVTVSGTPTSGQVPVASSSTAAAWGSPSTTAVSGVTVSGTPSASQVLTATSPTAASWSTPSTAATSVGGVTVTGTPAVGNVLTATSTSAANWQAPANPNVIDGVTVTGTPAAGQVIAATSPTAATWSTPSTAATSIGGVTVTGTPTSGQVLTASSGTAASWTNVTANTLSGVTVTGTPTSGQALIASSGTAATWSNITANSLGGVTVTGTPTSGQVLTASSGTAASWTNVTANSLGSVAVTGTPTAGQALIASSGTAASWSNVTANTIGGVTVSGTPAINQVLTATSGSAANWQSLPGQAFTVATGLVADDGASNAVAVANTNYLQTLINSASAAGGGAIRIPFAVKDYALTNIGSVLGVTLPDHVKLFGEGQPYGKTNTGFNAKGTSLCVGNATVLTQGTDVQALVTLNDHCGLHDIGLKGFGDSGNGHAPVVLYVGGCGSDIVNVSIDGGDGLGLYTDGNSIDNSYINVLLTQAANSGTFYYITSCTAATSVGDTTFQVAANTNIVPGMHVFTPGQNIGAIPSDAVVTKVNGTTVTIRDRSGAGTAPSQAQGGLQGNINGKTLVFLGSATGLVACSDNMFFGLRSITGGFKNNGADSQFIGCHWSSAGQNHTHNLIHYSSQGATYDGNTFDTEHGADEAHVLRIYGDATFTGCRIQCGANSPGETNGIPFIQDLGSDGLHGAQITGCLVPTVGSLPLTAMICVSKWLFDSTSQTYIPVVGATNTPSGSDQIEALRIAQSAIATHTDPLGQVVPVIMSQVNSAGGTHTGVYTPFQGQLGAVTWVQPSGSIQMARSTLPIASRVYNPHALDNTTGFLYLPSTGTNHAGFGSDPTDPTVFVPHVAGNYEVEWVCEVGSQNSVLQTLTFAIHWGTGTPPANTAAATGTAANINTYTVKPTAQNVNTLTFPMKGVIPITNAQAGSKVWFDLVGTTGGTNTISIVPVWVSLKGPYASYGF